MGGGVFFLCNLLGYSKTKQLLMSEKKISAPEALEIGFVDQVVPDNKLGINGHSNSSKLDSAVDTLFNRN